MKRFLKKVNRGLLLGGALLLALIVFIVIKEVQFRVELPKIRESVKDSVQAMLDINLAPEGAKLGEEWSDTQKGTMKKRLEDVLVAHWDADGESNFYYTAAEVRAAYDEYLGWNCGVIFEEISLELSDNDILISQNGTDYAKVSVEIDAMSATWRGNEAFLFYGEGVYVESPISPVSATYRGRFEGWLEMELHRVGGEWRVVGTSGYFSSVHKSVVTGGAN